jgi:hypothetical protein
MDGLLYRVAMRESHRPATEQKRCSTPTLFKRTPRRFRISVVQQGAISYVRRMLQECFRRRAYSGKRIDNDFQATLRKTPARSTVRAREYGWIKKMTYSSSDDDLDREIVSIGHSVGERNVATFGVLDVVRRQLRLPLFLPVAVLVGVILRRDDDTSLVGRKVRDNITPTLVIVDAQCDDEVLAGVGRETKGATRSATTHGEHMGSVGLAPRSAVGVFPDCLLDDVEKSVLVGLVDLCGDCVAHSRKK